LSLRRRFISAFPSSAATGRFAPQTFALFGNDLALVLEPRQDGNRRRKSQLHCPIFSVTGATGRDNRLLEGVVRNRFAAGACPVSGVRRRGWRFEVEPSLWVFREIWAAEGREFEIVNGEVNPLKDLFYEGLAAHMQRRTEEARYGWLGVGLQENIKNTNKKHSDASG